MRTLLFLFTAFAVALASAQDNVVPGYKMATPPVIDGTIDPKEWSGVPSARGSFNLQNGQVAPEDTQFWLAYDDKYVYFAAKAFDSHPGSIAANEYRTNVSLSGDDSITLQLDLSGSLADFNEFGMNPKGATSISLAGGRAAKREWSGEFVAKGRITPDGWEVEARIPWQIMRLPGAGARNVRFNVLRGHQRTHLSFAWQYTGDGHVERYGKWTGVELPKAPADRSLLLLPYGYAGADGSGPIVNYGLDMKKNTTDQVVMVGSINPDFRNIENAILSLDFSRFERLADETRPFFQEGSQYMNSALFASQRIESFDAGLNTYGRLGDHTSFGVLNTIDFGVQNSLVGNFTYDPNAKDSFRVTGTSMTQPGFHNDAYLLRYNRLIGPASIFVRSMGTEDTEVGKGLYNTASLGYSKGGLSLFSSWDAVSPEFLPRLGFAPEVDYKGFTHEVNYVLPVKSGPLQQANFTVFNQSLDRYRGGRYRKTLDVETHMLMRNNVAVGLANFQEDFLGEFDRLNSASLQYPADNPYRNASVHYDWGRLALHDYRSTTIGYAYRPIDKIQLTASYQHVDHTERSDLGILGMNWDLGKDQYVSGRVVKRDHDWNAYLAFRKSGNRGMEYFLILGDPNAETFKMSLILKVVCPVKF